MPEFAIFRELQDSTWPGEEKMNIIFLDRTGNGDGGETFVEISHDTGRFGRFVRSRFNWIPIRMRQEFLIGLNV